MDANGAWRLTFNGGITHSSLGMIGNGTNAYASTNYNPATIGPPTWDTSNGHIAAYLTATDVSNGTGEVIGVRRTTSPISRLTLNPRNASNNAEFYHENDTASTDISVPSMLGFQGITRTSTTNVATVITSGSQASATLASVNIPTGAVSLLARNTAGAFSNYLDATLGFASLGRYAMSGAQLEKLRDVVQYYQTELSRQV